MLFLAASILVTALSLGQAVRHDLLPLTACKVRGVDEDVLCGTLVVPEDRAHPGGRRLKLRVVVMPATSPDKSSEPIIFLAGGPGQAATQSLGGFAGRPVRQHHDLVFMDQRGTADPGSLACVESESDTALKSYFISSFEIGRIRQCRAQLAPNADLTHYASADAIADLEDLRSALGYRKVVLWGVSGGTRMAMLFALHDSAAVRSMVLSGVVAPQFRNPLPHARSAEDAFNALAAACDKEAACHEHFPALHAKLDSVLARLTRSPGATEVRHPQSHVLTPVTIRRDAFADGIRTLMYSSAQARFVPALVERSYAGDLHPMGEFMLARAQALRGGIAMGVLLDIVCSEDISRIREADIAPATHDTYLGDFRVREQMAACREWKAPAPTAWFSDRTRLSVPALLISGDFDPVTPAQWADSAAVYLRRTTRVHMAGGHGVFNACVDAMMVAFVADPDARLDTSCTASVTLPPFATMDELLKLVSSL